MRNEKPFELDHIGRLDDVAQGVFVNPPRTEQRKQDDAIMRKFIEQQKQNQKKSVDDWLL
jgi:hypothetical protein